jgi:hypothetical protein
MKNYLEWQKDRFLLSFLVSMMIAATLIFLSAFSSFAADGEWEQITQTKDGITVFKKDIPGSDVLAFKGEGVVDAPLSLIASVIFDFRRATEWVENLKESKVLRWENKSVFVEYDHVGTPFVLKDRDFVSRVTTTIDPVQHSLTIEYKSLEDSTAPKTSFVRGEIIHATFILTPVGSGKDQKTQVLADIHCDPKGSIPKWVVNFFQKDWPVDTFRNLRKQVRKPDIKMDPQFAGLFN